MRKIEQKIESERTDKDYCESLDEDCSNYGYAEYELIDNNRLCLNHATKHCEHMIEEFTLELSKLQKC